MRQTILLSLFISLLVFSNSVFAGQVILDNVEGTWFDGEEFKIIPGSPVEFHIRFI